MASKELKDYTGEELAELLSGEMQRLVQSFANANNSIVMLHLVQNELERRKLSGKTGS